MSQSSEPEGLPKDRLSVFVLGTAFMGLGLVGLLIGFGQAQEDLRACSSPAWRPLAAGLQWLNLGAGLSFVAMFCWWWARRKRPWDDPNPISFSRQPWSGREAWRVAVASLQHAWRAEPMLLAKDFSWLAQVSLVIIVIATSAVLVGLLLLCETCPTSFDGQCTAGIGSIAGSAFVTLIYYDMRIKYAGKTLAS